MCVRASECNFCRALARGPGAEGVGGAGVGECERGDVVVVAIVVLCVDVSIWARWWDVRSRSCTHDAVCGVAWRLIPVSLRLSIDHDVAIHLVDS